MTRPDNPGGSKAIAAGCRCPAIENRDGEGRVTNRAARGRRPAHIDIRWIIDRDCPLHGEPDLWKAFFG